MSENYQQLAGVPQGPILGPLPFTIFLNDNIVNNIKVLMHADDLKLFVEVCSTNDCIVLQKCLDDTTNWCQNNLLPLNPDKIVSHVFYPVTNWFYF